MTQLLEAKKARKAARGACNRHDVLHSTNGFRDFHSVLFTPPDTPVNSGHSLP